MFGKALRFNHETVFAVASWLTGNRADAEDVVQEACLRAFRAIGGFAGVNARAWVLTIVRNTAYSWLAKNRTPDFVAFQTVLDEEQHLARLADYGSRHFAHFSYILRMQTLYLWGEHESALGAAPRHERNYDQRAEA